MTMDILNFVLCLLEDILGSIFGFLNATIGSWLDFELTVPDLGCEVDA
jgi:hypothetical protein